LFPFSAAQNCMLSCDKRRLKIALYALLCSGYTFLLVAFRTIYVSVISLTHEAYEDISDYSFVRFSYNIWHWHSLVRFSCDGYVIAWIEILKLLVMVFVLI